jgi:outer membrane receptor protein involved in Fe transport
VLTGSASAIYGSDAIAGVVNFILKKKADGTTIDMRMGTTTEGGGESFDMSIGQRLQPWQLNAVHSVELQSQTRCGPMSATSRIRPRTAPPRFTRIARRAYLRTDYNDDYLDQAPPPAALAGQNQGSTYHATARSTATTAAATRRSATAPSSASAAVPTATPR